MRAIPAGILSRRFVGGFTIVMSAVFIACAAQLNPLALLLSPIALGVVLFYSYTKRFTRWSHLFLGLAYFVAPAAAWVAIRGSLDPRILVLAGAGMFWVAGFDVFYSCQDAEHDRKCGLNSIPATMGVPQAFVLARLMHLAMVGLLAWMVFLFGLGPIAIGGLVLVTALLAYEHSIISPRDLTRINAAFFTMNGVISIVFFVAIAGDVLARGAHAGLR
jgi:4-hydroxybenzoate polyprenyltransferase